ncbi:MAG: hypothetical protein ACLGH0_15365, partial [Thermoanaerobaculia bacterium]
ARDLTGWNAAVVEFFLRLGWTQNMNHVRLDAPVWLDLRDSDGIERLQTPFERAMRTVDVRRIKSGRGKHNIPNIGVFLWRIEAFSLTSSPAFKVDAVRWMFSPLGNDTPLFSMSVTETEITHLAERENVPMPITHRSLAKQTALWYGDPGSILVRLGGVPVHVDNIDSCDLSDAGVTWDHAPAQDGMASIDPVLGRLALPSDPNGVVVRIGMVDHVCTRVDANRYTCPQPITVPFEIRIGGVPVDPARVLFSDTDADNRWTPPRPERDFAIVDLNKNRLLFPYDPAIPRVTYHYGMPGPVGGGEYERQASFENPGTKRIRVPEDRPTILQAIAALGVDNGVIEITDSGRYVENLNFNLAIGQRVELRARNSARPTIITANISVSGGKRSQLSLNGLLIANGGIAVPNTAELELLSIKHCTLVPGRSLDRKSVPQQINLPSLMIAAAKSLLTVKVEHCISGAINMQPVSGTLEVRDSIVENRVPHWHAIGIQPNGLYGPKTTVERSTILGITRVQELTLGSESIFTDQIQVQRKQQGCVRFSYVLKGSTTPRRYRCQPEFAAREAVDARARELAPNPVPLAEMNAITNRYHDIIKPQFVSRAYGTPAYAQLARFVHRAITNGAEDSSEMGVYHGV